MGHQPIRRPDIFVSMTLAIGPLDRWLLIFSIFYRVLQFFPDKYLLF